MKIKLYIFLAIANFFVTDFSMAQPQLPPNQQIWTLEQSIDYAKQNNIQINTLRLTGSQGEEDLMSSRAAKHPNLFGTFSTVLINSNGATASAGLAQPSSVTNSYGANSSMILYNGGYLNNDIKQKILSLEAAGLDVAAAENDITIQVTQAYLDILLAKENIIYLQDIYQTSQAQLQRGQIEYNVGSIAEKDLLQLQAQTATDKYNLVTAQNAVRQNTVALKQLLQLPWSYDLNIEKPDTVIASSPVEQLGDVEEKALGERPEVKSSELNAQVAQVNLLKARAGRLPLISANAGLATDYSDIASNGYAKQLDNNFYERIGLTLSIPIFNNRIAKTNIEKSKIDVQQANLDLANTKTVLSQQVELYYNNAISAASQYDAALDQLNANKKSYKIANEQLKLGAIATVDYLLQKNLYIQAFQSYVQTKYNAVIAVKIYDFYNGQPVKL